MSVKHFVIILAGGKGERMQTETLKQFLVLGKKPVLFHSLNTFFEFDKKCIFSVVLPKNQILQWKKICKQYEFKLSHNIILGGKTRYESVKNALLNLKINKDDMISIHDGVRPFISKKLIKKLYKSALLKGHAAPILTSNDSLRMYIENSITSKSVDRAKYIFTQTPQIFRASIIKNAYKKEKDRATDDITLIEDYVQRVNLIKGEKINMKITTKEDWDLAQKIIRS
tara:strand:- start:503 stop:1183 length:681 start_codon:yes stop_codon:yes gene_type:complete